MKLSPDMYSIILFGTHSCNYLVDCYFRFNNKKDFRVLYDAVIYKNIWLALIGTNATQKQPMTCWYH